jgi:hypothetical protein
MLSRYDPSRPSASIIYPRTVSQSTYSSSMGPSQTSHTSRHYQPPYYTSSGTLSTQAHRLPHGPNAGPLSPDSQTDQREYFYCPHEDCKDETGQPNRRFSRKADVSRHIKTTHEKEYISCPYNRCPRTGVNGFTRQDHLTEHLRGYHKEMVDKRRSTYR